MACVKATRGVHVSESIVECALHPTDFQFSSSSRYNTLQICLPGYFHSHGSESRFTAKNARVCCARANIN